MMKQEFYNTYCKYCENTQCHGPKDDFLDRCPHFVDWEGNEEVFLPEYDTINFISNNEQIKKIF